MPEESSNEAADGATERESPPIRVDFSGFREANASLVAMSARLRDVAAKMASSHMPAKALDYSDATRLKIDPANFPEVVAARRQGEILEEQVLQTQALSVLVDEARKAGNRSRWNLWLTVAVLVVGVAAIVVPRACGGDNDSAGTPAAPQAPAPARSAERPAT